MDRKHPAASLALIRRPALALGLALALAVMSVSATSEAETAQTKRQGRVPAQQQAPNRVAPKTSRAPSATTVRTRSAPGVRRTVARPPMTRHHFSLGVANWREAHELKRFDDRKFRIGSDLSVVAFGWRWEANARHGWQLEVQGFYGEATSQSQQPDLTYLNQNDPVMGASLFGGWFTHLGDSGVKLTLGLGTIFRELPLREPTAYSFPDGPRRQTYPASFEIAIPIYRNVQLLQRFATPVVGDRTTGALWLMGIGI